MSASTSNGDADNQCLSTVPRIRAWSRRIATVGFLVESPRGLLGNPSMSEFTESMESALDRESRRRQPVSERDENPVEEPAQVHRKCKTKRLSTGTEQPPKKRQELVRGQAYEPFEDVTSFGFRLVNCNARTTACPNRWTPVLSGALLVECPSLLTVAACAAAIPASIKSQSTSSPSA